MRRSETFHTNDSGFVKAMEFVQQFLADCGIEKKAKTKALLVVEEALGSLMEHRCKWPHSAASGVVIPGQSGP